MYGATVGSMFAPWTGRQDKKRARQLVAARERSRKAEAMEQEKGHLHGGDSAGRDEQHVMQERNEHLKAGERYLIQDFNGVVKAGEMLLVVVSFL